MYSELDGGYAKKDFVDFLQKNQIMVLAVEDRDWPVQATTVFYAMENEDALLLKSHTTSHHGSVIKNGAKVVVVIYDQSSTYTNKTGVQLRGICERIYDKEEMVNAVKIYSDTFEGAAARFAPLDELVSAQAKSTLFRIKLVSGKMLSPEGYSPDFQKVWD